MIKYISLLQDTCIKLSNKQEYINKTRVGPRVDSLSILVHVVYMYIHVQGNILHLLIIGK